MSASAGTRLSASVLAARAGVEDADIARSIALGLLDAREDWFDGADLARARLLAFAARRGIGAHAIA